MLSEFSAAAGDLAGTLEELAASTQLDNAAPILEKLERMAPQLVEQVAGITVEACAVKLKVWTNTRGQPVLDRMSSGHLTIVPLWAQYGRPFRRPFARMVLVLLQPEMEKRHVRVSTLRGQ